MEKTYLNISITYFSRKDIAPSVLYYRHKGNDEAIFTENKLTVDEANQLMWELVKLGGKNHYESNMFKNSICTREVSFWGVL